MNVREVFAGENRRAAIMGAIGAPVILALLVVRLLSGGDTATLAPPAGPAIQTGVVAPAAGTVAPAAAAAPVPRPSLPVDPALLRDPFCPLVAAAAAPGAPPTACAPRSAPTTGQQTVGLKDIFGERGILLARMQIGEFTFANLRTGETAPGGLRVVSLTDRCGEFEMAGGPFPLCIGEQTSK
jgi:hypothetical protein